MALTVDSLPVDPRVIAFWKESIQILLRDSVIRSSKS